MVWSSEISVVTDWSLLRNIAVLNHNFTGTLIRPIVSTTLRKLTLGVETEDFILPHERRNPAKPFELGNLPCLEELTIRCDRQRLTKVRWVPHRSCCFVKCKLYDCICSALYSRHATGLCSLHSWYPDCFSDQIISDPSSWQYPALQIRQKLTDEPWLNYRESLSQCKLFYNSVLALRLCHAGFLDAGSIVR